MTTIQTAALDTIRTVAAKCASGWTTADWTHELSDGKRRDEPEYCDGNTDGCSTCESAESAAEHGAAEHGAACVAAAEQGDMQRALDEAKAARSLESDFGDAPTYSLLVEAVEAAMRCQCGQATGVRCRGTLGADAVEIDWMPEHLRGSHVAAGNRGSYPSNGAQRLRVTPACADMLISDDGDWTERVAA